MLLFKFIDAPGKKILLLASTMGAFLTPFMGSSINVALPEISRDLEMDVLLMGWVANAFLITSAMFLVPLGRIADIYGRKRIFTSGLVIFTLSSFLSGLAGSAHILICLRVLQGMSSAMIFGNSVAILSSAFPEGERGRVLGINVASVYAGLAVGPYVGGLLTEYLGWRSIFFVSAFLGLTTVIMLIWKVKEEWIMSYGEKFDWVGSLIYAIMLFATMYGLSRPPTPSSLWFLLLTLVSLAMFIRWEEKVTSPILKITMFRNNTAFAFSNLAALINYSATFATTLLMSLYLQYIKGFSAHRAGLFLIFAPLVQALISPFAGRLSDRFEPRLIASVGMTLTVVALALLSHLSRETSLTFLVICLLIFGLGFALFSSPNTNAVISAVESKFYGVASATLATARSIGMAMSISFTIFLFSLFIGPVQIKPENYDAFLQSTQIAFIIFSVLCFVGIFVSLARGKNH